MKTGLEQNMKRENKTKVKATFSCFFFFFVERVKPILTLVSTSILVIQNSIVHKISPTHIVLF